ncbi:hypothetical protein PXK30_21750 [Phaeobacter gallaeciensis]|uniref:hypothetical protein n=1 Tax=Phaeobacter gallaeciensis TaxID=60890 RepID=UPI00237EED20|nr:hypothetical protein [Phaeobacter gallaeciensis]MDE4306265.1 hypothetical protein [Phaeobacter gallaeciensis]MDE4310731.1 hypothetical protein [Phaeobacter gallaeciensis]MDE4315152.1 hypothetical protein [Phaeobacter gallaeciensis]MDE4319663.1 hypothetical protein [Phaeobacter gallaeciensis]MDE4324091.1 hypothetical protein [Phaeobacter gallaeciensis]
MKQQPEQILAENGLQLHAKAYSARTSALINSAVEKFASADMPIAAISAVFRDAPFNITGPVLEGLLIASDSGLVRLSEPELPQALQPVWEELSTAIEEDMTLLSCIGDGIENIRCRGCEILAGQVWLIPWSVSVVGIHGRQIAARAQVAARQATHFINVATQKEIIGEVKVAVAETLDFLRDSAQDNRVALSTIDRLVRPAPRVIPPVPQDFEEIVELLRSVGIKQ